MPHSCVVPNCRSNYSRGKDKGPNVTIFAFPQNEELKNKWIQAIKRENFTPTKYSRVCELHFKTEEVERSTRFYTQTGDTLDVPLAKPRLKPNAIPSKLPGCPKYLSCDSQLRESPDSKRRRLQNDALYKAVQESIESERAYTENQALLTLDDIYTKFKNKPIGLWMVNKSEKHVYFIHMTESLSPEIDFLVYIEQDMNLSIKYQQVELQHFYDGTEKISLPVPIEECNTLENILQKIVDEKQNDKEGVIRKKIDLLVKILDDLVADMPAKKLAINFFKEQISLLTHYNKKSAIRYSYETLLFCSLFLAISPHAYKFVRSYDFFTLPCLTTVKKICNNSLTDPRLEQSDQGFLQYMRLKVSLLSQKDMIVNLQVDEVHLLPYMDYKSGSVVGGAVNSTECASTACTFMINSYLSNYMDVVHVAPVRNLNGNDLHKFIRKIICGLEDLGFVVLSTVADNHRINRNAMASFSSTHKLMSIYPHPSDNERPLFYAVDPVHLLKNVRNSWLGKHPYVFTFPDFNDFRITKTAKFNSLREMHQKEENQLLKYGYTLSRKGLYPTSMEKQNVKLALQIFNRTTVVALRELGPITNIESYAETADFIEIICTWWDIVNVKSCYKGIAKRNKYMEPIFPTSHHIFKFLNKFVAWLDKWENYPHGKLTVDTHKALRLTTDTFLKISEYCLKEKKFEYVLLGKIQSDPLERRFGNYRYYAGSQYLISVRQVFEVEKKLRLMSLVPLIIQSKSGNIIITKEDMASFVSYGNEAINYENFHVNPTLKNTSMIEEGDIDIIHKTIWPSLVYVAGYASYSLLKLIKCAYCKEFLINTTEALPVESYPTNLISARDRGGLCYPKEDVILVAAYAFVTVEKLLKQETLFLKEENQRAVVISSTLENINNNELYLFMGHNCDTHSTNYLLRQLLFKFANLLLKNYAKKRTDTVTKKHLMPQLKRLKPCDRN